MKAGRAEAEEKFVHDGSRTRGAGYLTTALTTCAESLLRPTHTHFSFSPRLAGLRGLQYEIFFDRYIKGRRRSGLIFSNSLATLVK